MDISVTPCHTINQSPMKLTKTLNPLHKHLSFAVVATVAALMLVAAPAAAARKFNDKVLNRPYADNRRFHLGFSVGMHTQDISFASNGFVTENGETWFVEQPSFQPGFCVNGLVDLRLNQYFNLRFNPGLYFGTRDIRMFDTTNGGTEKQTLKSTFVVLPFDLKYSSVRYRNARPYLTAGVMPAIDVAKNVPTSSN